MKRKTLTLLSMVLVIVMLFSVTSYASDLKEVSREKTLVWAVPELPNGADNEIHYTAEAQEMERNLYDSPLTFSKIYDEATGFILPNYNDIVGSLAESWTVSDDGKVITFRFREGVKSHAGNELKADDFIYKWERGFRIMNNTGTFGAQSQQIYSMDQIKKIDDYTVEITMAGANPIGEAFLTHVCQLIIDSEEFKKHETPDDPNSLNWSSTNASGYGPWTLVEFTPGVRIILDRFDDYWDKENLPWFERVIILEIPQSSNRAAMVQTGDVDAATKLLNSELAKVSEHPNVKTMHYDGNKTVIVGINQKAEGLSNALVRRALSFAVPYQDIIDTVYLGQAKQLKSLICSTYPLHNGNYFAYQHDLEKAKALLVEAGFPDGFKTKITIDNTNSQAEQIALLYQSSLRQIGVSLEIEKLQAGDYYNLLSNKAFEGLYVFVDSAGVPDGGFALQLGAKTGSINNMGHYSNEEVDVLIEKLMSTTDTKMRQEYADRIQEIVVWEDPYCLYIVEPGFDLALNKNIMWPQWDTIQQIHWNTMYRSE